MRTSALALRKPPMAAQMTNTVFYLVGPPGVGKMTVGKMLAQELGGPLVSNHLWLNPVLSLIEQDGISAVPEAVWPLVGEIRRAVFETAKSLTPQSWNLVFTHAAAGESEADRLIANEILDVARTRGARLIVIQLTCSAEALASRVAIPERRLQFKESDADAARQNALLAPFDPGHPQTFLLDTTNLSAEDTCKAILRRSAELL